MVVRERREQDTVRVSISLPRELVEQVDAVVGSRKRSRFIVEAVEDRLRADHDRTDPEEERRQRIAAARAALDEMAGSLSGDDISGWESSESAAEWVRRSREEPGFLTAPPIRPADRE
jgi:Arc/MetJ-type ribon-helix-helix transcriptional regulator